MIILNSLILEVFDVHSQKLGLGRPWLLPLGRQEVGCLEPTKVLGEAAGLGLSEGRGHGDLCAWPSFPETSGLIVCKHIICVVCCSQDALVPLPRDPSLSSSPGGLLLPEGPQASSSADSFDSRAQVPRLGKQLVLTLGVTAFLKNKKQK